MKRVIITPPVLPPSALADLKQWLGISGGRDDAPLAALLAASLDLCEAFTGIVPIAALCEDVLPASADWQALSARPVQAIGSVESLSISGARQVLPVQAYAIDLAADGTGRVRITDAGNGSRIAVRFTAGLAQSSKDLPEALRHGMIRLAAHQHRAREVEADGAMPPAAIAALWRPWRRLRLA